MLAGLLAVLAILSHAGQILGGIRTAMLTWFGTAWFVPVVAIIAASAYLLWPKAPKPRAVDVVAGLVAVLSLVGLFSLAAGAGGSLGRGIDSTLTGMFTIVGAWALLIAGLVIGLIVTIHFSPGALLVTAVGALRSANAERARLRDLVAAPAAEKPKPAKQVPASSDLLTRSAASFATAPAAPDQRKVWDVDEPEEPEMEKPRLEPAAAVAVHEPLASERAQPALRVVAEPEDDVPEIEWKLPAITLLDTVTARRERMADEIKRNVKVIESTLQQFGVEAKVIGVNPGPAVTQFEVQPGAGVQVKRITALQNDLSLALAAAPLRIEAPIPGKSAVGIEVPNKSASLVTIREVIETAAFREGTNKLALGLGNDVSGQSIVADLTRMPHLLIAGATGQGKSV
jgi:DNA segregation ATPase FtsK/SpoIIIE-like protein